MVTPLGLAGDAHRESMHGGPDRALCLWAIEIIDRLRLEGHDRISPGSTGDNVTTTGLAWSALAPGARLALGDVICELTELTTPCRTIMNQFADRKFGRIAPPALSRWYARVIRTGVLQVGDPIQLL